MKINFWFWLTLFILLINISSTAQVNIKEQQKRQLESLNNQLTAAVVTKDLNQLIRFYAPDAICLPEYQPMIRGADQIRKYSEEVFNRQQVKRFDKKIMEVIDLKKYVAEIGTFTKEFTASGSEQLFKQSGKYFNIWQVQPNGSWQLKAESFGYFENAPNPASLVVKLLRQPTDSRHAESSDDKNASFELSALNSLMEKSVHNRDGNLRADFFADDAIFMPFADTMKIGIKAIREHLIEYNSGSVTIDSIKIYSDDLEVVGSYVIEYPRFEVSWHTAEQAGRGAGKGLRLWRREPNCSLKLYREIGLHDYLEDDKQQTAANDKRLSDR